MEKKKMTLTSILQFLCLCVGGNIIYYVAFMRGSYYDSFMQAFTMTNAEFGVLFSAYAITSVGTYFIGGVLTDKFSPRKLLTISFASTGLLNLWFGTFPGYKVAVVIYALLGVSTTLGFWSAMIKATRQFGRIIGEGKALGLLEGGRSISGAIISTFGLFLFSRAIGAIGGLRAVIMFYGCFLLVVALVTWFVFKDENTSDIAKENVWQLVKECLKNKNAWIMAFIILGIYATGSGLSYVAPYATSVFAATATIAALLGIFRDYFQPVGALIGGFVSDKMGISKFIFIGCIVLAICDSMFIFIPSKASMIIILAIVTAVSFTVLGALRGQYYATQKDARIPMTLSGTVIGLMATIGYTPDIYLSPIFGSFIDKFNTVTAYKYIFLTLAGFAVFSAILTFIFMTINKKNIELNKKEEAANRSAVE